MNIGLKKDDINKSDNLDMHKENENKSVDVNENENVNVNKNEKKLTYLEKLEIISDIKRIFENEIEKNLDVTKVGCPLFVKTSSGLQDTLTGVEKAVSFTKDEEKYEIVHSLAKWKREALGRYSFPLYKGLYTDMKAIRQSEKIDKIHSLCVEQWDWEKVIRKEDRNIDYLKDTVRKIYISLRKTATLIKKKYKFLSLDIERDFPKEIYFITGQELEDLYPNLTSKEREEIITREKKAVFIIGIGDKLKSGIPHDLRSPDYDDWKLDGDLLFFDKALNEAIEISSMGIRVDEITLMSQLEKSNTLDRVSLPYHEKILNKRLPYTIGGGIGQSRVFMLILGSKHIAEVQPSSWSNKTLNQIENIDIL